MRVPERYYDYAAWTLVVLYVLFVVSLGPRIHPIEDIHGMESDGYLDRVDELREGKIPKDPFRPLLYTLLSTLAAEWVDDTFLGAKLVSALSGGFTVLAAYCLGASLFGRRIGLFGAILVGTNRHILQASFHAATDIVFCALATFAFFFQIRFLRSGRYRDIVPVSLFFAGSFFTRYVAVFFLPVFVGGILFQTGPPVKRRLGSLVVFLGCAFVFLIPHFTLQTLSLGDPFYNENWRNLPYKMTGFHDVDFAYKSDTGNLWEVIAGSPKVIFKMFANEVGKMVFYDFMKLNGHNTAGAFFLALLVLGVLSLLPTQDASRLSILCAIGAYLFFVCLFFRFDPRVALPILPLSYPLIANFVLGPSFSETLSFWGRRVGKGYALAAVFLILNLQASRDDLRAIQDRHPVEELQAAIQLQEENGKDLVVAGTYWATYRHVDYDFHLIPMSLDEKEWDAVAYLNRYRLALQELGVTHLIVGKKTLFKRPEALLTGQGVPHYLRKIKQTEFVTLYRFAGYGP